MAADFVERRWLRDFEFDGTAASRSAHDALVERGATFFRLSFKSMSGEVVMEGWRVQPDDQGDVPV